MGKNRAGIKFLILVIVLLLWPAGNEFGQVGKSPAQPYIAAGDKLYEQGKLKEALSAYEQALQLDPKNQYASFQIIQINIKLSSGEKPIANALPARDYSRITYELGPYYKDPVNRFAIRPPKGWMIDNSDPNFNVKFIDPYNEAFIFVKVIPTPSPVHISYEFQSQIENLVKNIAAQIPNARLKYCNFEKLIDETVLRVEVHYQAGSNNIIINARMITELERVVMVTWVCKERLFIYFRPGLESSVATINLNPR